MDRLGVNRIARRNFLAGAAAVSVLALPGCTTMGGGGLGLVDVLRRLLTRASGDAFAKLTASDGFWNSTVARIEMPQLFGRSGGLLKGILSSTAFRNQLQHRLNNFAESGARRAAPLVADAVRSMSVTDALSILKGGPTAATSFLRAQMGPSLVNAMIPELSGVMRAANDPLIGQAITALTGVNIDGVAHSLALGADNSIWYEIGASETDIRQNPEKTGDPALIAALKVL